MNDVIPRLVSVNIGSVRTVAWRGREVTTGIWKHPASGRVGLRGVNFVGDDQADRTVHGGPDKAVYAYAHEDYDYWHDVEASKRRRDFSARISPRSLSICRVR